MDFIVIKFIIYGRPNIRMRQRSLHIRHTRCVVTCYGLKMMYMRFLMSPQFADMVKVAITIDVDWQPGP